MKRLFVAISTLTLLNGCSMYQEDFDCPIGKGEKCASLSSVNSLADQGMYSTSMIPEKPHLSPQTTIYYPKTNEQLVV